jgi:hypothetical protein
VRTWEASSQKVTSRSWCSISMAQCPRRWSARRAGPAWAKPRLVIAETVTVCHRRRRLLACAPPTVRLRVTRMTWAGGRSRSDRRRRPCGCAPGCGRGRGRGYGPARGRGAGADWCNGPAGSVVGLDLKQVVGLLSPTRNPGGLRVGLEGVGGDDHASEVEAAGSGRKPGIPPSHRRSKLASARPRPSFES